MCIIYIYTFINSSHIVHSYIHIVFVSLCMATVFRERSRLKSTKVTIYLSYSCFYSHFILFYVLSGFYVLLIQMPRRLQNVGVGWVISLRMRVFCGDLCMLYIYSNIIIPFGIMICASVSSCVSASSRRCLYNTSRRVHTTE